jgi:hypothetical protein
VISVSKKETNITGALLLELYSISVNEEERRLSSRKYMVQPPCNSNTLSQQLLVRHRNCFEIALLMEHFKHTSALGGHLDPIYDLPLEKDTLPNGR